MMKMMRMNRKKVNEQKNKTPHRSFFSVGFLGYMKTPAVPIPTPPSMTQQTQSLPQRQSTINFRIDPPVRTDSDEFDYLFNQHRYSSTPLP